MPTQHFCLFLKKRNQTSDNSHKKNGGRCLSCNAKISQYHNDDVCWPCTEKIKTTKEDGEYIESEADISEMEAVWMGDRNASKKARTIVTLWRVCKGRCGGNGETVFADADPNQNTIIISQTSSVREGMRCGGCGGPLIFYRDLVPGWARDFSLALSGKYR